MNNKLLSKDKKYVLAISGGSDSMALLDMCYQANYNIVVAHMNYQIRDSAIIETKIVEDYCVKHGIPFFVHYQAKIDKGNFQGEARISRYAFFKEVLRENECDALLTAHHKDDFIETYLMYQKRASVQSYWGIAPLSTIKTMLVIRVLLDYYNSDLRSYCEDHQVMYHDDESNEDMKYLRNRIRKVEVSVLDKKEKDELYLKIIKMNMLNQEKMGNISYLKGEGIATSKLKNMSGEMIKIHIRKMLQVNGVLQISEKSADQVCDWIKMGVSKWLIQLSKKIVLYEEYGLIQIDQEVSETYSYIYDEVVMGETKHFKLVDHGLRIQGCNISDSDLPINIRGVRDGDKIALRYGHKSVNRFLIDRKIRRNQRANWLVIENAQKEIIFVEGIGCEKNHFANKMNVYVVK